jgi:hypothetical protein
MSEIDPDDLSRLVGLVKAIATKQPCPICGVQIWKVAVNPAEITIIDPADMSRHEMQTLMRICRGCGHIGFFSRAELEHVSTKLQGNGH